MLILGVISLRVDDAVEDLVLRMRASHGVLIELWHLVRGKLDCARRVEHLTVVCLLGALGRPRITDVDLWGARHRERPQIVVDHLHRATALAQGLGLLKVLLASKSLRLMAVDWKVGETAELLEDSHLVREANHFEWVLLRHANDEVRQHAV